MTINRFTSYYIINIKLNKDLNLINLSKSLINKRQKVFIFM
jgi:hypothetical protein